MKKYKINKTKKLIKKLKPYWAEFAKMERLYYIILNNLEIKMSKELKIKGLQLFYCDNECVGIGNLSRTMKLIHREELEGGK